MSDPNNKLDFSAISFDDVVGAGAPGLDVAEAEEPQEVEVTEEIDNELDEDARERGDEDHEDYVDEDYDEGEEKNYVEDEHDDDDEEESDLELDDDVTVAGQISKILGFEVENDYADTVEGITEFVRDISQEVAEAQIQELFEQFPEVQQHLDYVLSGGESTQFFEAYNPQADFNNIELAENDVLTQKNLLAQYFQVKGHDEAFIREMIGDYEDAGKLYNKAAIAKDELAKVQQYQRQQMMEQQRAMQEEREIEEERFWDGVANTLEDGVEFGGITIPDRDKRDFFDYISNPIDETGNTQRDLDYQEADIDIKLAIDYLLYSGFELNDIINTKAKSVSARNLRDRIVSNEEQVRNARGAQRRKQKRFDPDQLDINALF